MNRRDFIKSVAALLGASSLPALPAVSGDERRYLLSFFYKAPGALTWQRYYKLMPVGYLPKLFDDTAILEIMERELLPDGRYSVPSLTVRYPQLEVYCEQNPAPGIQNLRAFNRQLSRGELEAFTR